jgi:tetratricopeptide (TPR) repeat protein
MRRLLSHLFLLVELATIALAQDPLKVAPEAYQLAFENEYVRVERVHYAPRVKIAKHDHTAYGTAYVYLNDTGPVKFGHVGLAYGAVTRPAVKAGSFRLYKAVKETHTVESLSDEPSNFLRVEFKTETAKDPNTLRGKFFRPNADEAAPANENFQQVQFENEQLRITRLLCVAGKSYEFALNAKEPSLFVALNDIQFKPSRGKLLKLTAGQTRWLAAGKGEQWTNAGKDAAEWLRFEFKTAPMKGAATEPAHKLAHDNTGEAAKKAEAAALLKRGASLDSEGRMDESIATHLAALKLDAALMQAHINLISLYGRARQFAQAETHYQKALAINPDLPVLHYNFGVLLVGQDRFEQAARAFQQCLRLDPYYAEAHFNLGSIIERDSGREGKLDEAAAHFRKAIANQPNHRAAHFSLGRILVNQNQLAEAIEHFHKTLTPEDEETPRYTYALGAVYVRAGDKAKGIEYLRKALARATALRQTALAQSIERDLQALAQ